MPRNGSGTYTLPAGNPVEPGTVIESNWANATLEDIGDEITDSLSRTGEGGMLAPFRLFNGSAATPGLAFLNETSSGLYRAGPGEFWASVLGIPILQYTVNGILLSAGKTLAVTSNATIGGTLGVTGNVTFSGTLAASGAITATGGVIGNVTGNVTAASGSSTFNNVTINGTLDMTSGVISGLSDPVANTDAANKQYVDSVAQGLDAKASCVAATTGNITLSGTQTIDGVAVTAGLRVLVKDQTSAAENGIYVAAAGAWNRAADANTWDELVSAFVFVEGGTLNDDNGYVCTISAGGTLGTTPVTWTQFSGAGQVIAGAGMVKVGNTLNVQSASSSRITVGADEIDLATTGVSAGTYKSLTVDIYGRVMGGTNPTTLAGYGITDAYTTSYIDALFGSTSSAAASATAAAASAISASGSATSAANSATAAAASFDSFDDRYLGAKASDPTVDNDGNPLITGALYFNTTSNEMRVYTGSVWLASYIPATTYVQGPVSATTNALARFDGVTGKLIKNSAVTADDAGNVTAASFIGNVTGNVSGNAGTVTNGVYTTGTYADPAWITSLATSKLTGAVAVGNGGTGATTLATNSVLLGNGTSAVQAVAPGAAGNVLTSDGTTWTSSAPSGLPAMNIVTGTSQAASALNQYVLTNAAATTLTLPASPAAGAVVWVTVANGRTDNVVARNGENIQSIAEDMTLNAAYAAVQLRYVNSTIGWSFT